jgi:putative ABC transport system permease protein
MRSLDRKLLRDLWAIRSQVLAIAAVIGSGIALLVMSRTTFLSLQTSLDEYYTKQKFADVFANAKRAPDRLEERIRAIDGVRAVQTRVVVDVTLDVAGMEEPAKGRLVSLPERGRPELNDLHLRSGRWIDPNRPDEVLVSSAFARAHGLRSGDQLHAIINGRRKRLEIAGVALSPEYVYSIRPGDLFPDPKRFGVVWIARRPLATAFDMEGGFNDVALALDSGATVAAVIADLDRLLAPYGGIGAIPRDLQTSHWYLRGELTQLKGMALFVPLIFLGVATFLLNVVLRRLVSVQREQIAALKALGYSNWDVGRHFLEWAAVVAVLGTLMGIATGAWLGRGMLRMYLEYFEFPRLVYAWSSAELALAFLLGLLAAGIGAVGAVRAAVKLPPAEAMRPQPPASYRETFVERMVPRRWLTQPSRMIVRNLARRPLRTSASIIGIAFAGGIMVVGVAFLDAMDELTSHQFDEVQRQDVTVAFNEPLSAGAVHALERLPGVLRVEAQRGVGVRLRNGARSRQIGVVGLPPNAELWRIVDADDRVIVPPDDGVLLSDKLAELLGVAVGETVRMEVLEGTRPVREVRVAGTVREYIGTSAYMTLAGVHRLLREGESLSGASLSIDSQSEEQLMRRFKNTPTIAGVGLRRAVLENFDTYLRQNMDTMMGSFMFFACVIAFGVIYNTARIALSERARELASLRVMGFRRGEISYILLGELALLTMVAIPVGMVLGYGLVFLVLAGVDSELYRIPVVVSQRVFFLSAATVMASAVVSGWIVRRRLDHLDLIGVLKTRE